VLQTIELDCGCFACMLGGADGATLFVLAAQFPPASWGPDAERTGRVLAIRAAAPRAGWP
jgi:sugar lactone lactonase YvrE